MIKKKQHFTLFELLISVGLLVILTVVILRTLLLTTDFWSSSEEQARLYADAKTVFMLISEDLENIIYQQDTTASGDTSITDASKYITAPLWIGAMSYTGSKEPIDSYAGYPGNKKYGASLHMITRTNRGLADAAYAYIAQVGYYFVPPTQSGADWSGTYSGDGELVRYCIGDNSTSYNFMNEKAVDKIHPASIASSDLKEVVTGILDFRIHAYANASDWNEAVYPADLVGRSGSRIKIVENKAGTGQTDLTGAKNIQTVLVMFTLIPPNRLEQLRQINNADERKTYLQKYSRTFRKTFRIRKFSGD
jgi:type II secretory pathway pseudopilin PulG